MKIHRGTTPEDSFKIHLPKTAASSYGLISTNDIIQENITKQLDQLFGNQNGDYFIYSSQERKTVLAQKTYKILIIEDKDTIQHTIFFEIVKG